MNYKFIRVTNPSCWPACCATSGCGDCHPRVWLVPPLVTYKTQQTRVSIHFIHNVMYPIHPNMQHVAPWHQNHGISIMQQHGTSMHSPACTNICKMQHHGTSTQHQHLHQHQPSKMPLKMVPAGPLHHHEHSTHQHQHLHATSHQPPHNHFARSTVLWGLAAGDLMYGLCALSQ